MIVVKRWHQRLLDKPWIWAFVAAFLVWLATIVFTQGQGAGAVLTAALAFATFSVIVGLGQMYVITLGPGNVDLSIPATMTFAGAVSMKIMDTHLCIWRFLQFFRTVLLEHFQQLVAPRRGFAQQRFVHQRAQVKKRGVGNLCGGLTGEGSLENGQPFEDFLFGLAHQIPRVLKNSP